MEVEQDLYLCFKDFTKAFVTVKHENLAQILQNLNVDGGGHKLIRNTCWQQTEVIKVNNKISGYQSIAMELDKDVCSG